MTATTQFFCDWCNPSRQVRSEGDECASGYTVLLVERLGRDVTPLGWWTVPGAGPSGAIGHCCQDCFLSNPTAASEVQRARAAASQAILGQEVPQDVTQGEGPGGRPGVPAAAEREANAGPRWPSRSSPFGDAEAVDGD